MSCKENPDVPESRPFPLLRWLEFAAFMREHKKILLLIAGTFTPDRDQALGMVEAAFMKYFPVYCKNFPGNTPSDKQVDQSLLKLLLRERRLLILKRKRNDLHKFKMVVRPRTTSHLNNTVKNEGYGLRIIPAGKAYPKHN